jgi:hypothetical protein
VIVSPDGLFHSASRIFPVLSGGNTDEIPVDLGGLNMIFFEFSNIVRVKQSGEFLTYHLDMRQKTICKLGFAQYEIPLKKFELD